MSSGAQNSREEALARLVRELRQFYGLGESFLRAAATQSGMNVTDLQVIDMLESGGSATAGQLADGTGLTTGAITGMLNRLEEAGIVRRERDPDDGRRVIVRLAKRWDDLPELGAAFASFERAWGEAVSSYTDERIAFLLEFLSRGNAISRQELVRLRDTPASEDDVFSTPPGDVRNARLVIASGASRLSLRADATMDDLYQARFTGRAPDVKLKDGVVTLRYPRRLLSMGTNQDAADVALTSAIPWTIAIQAGMAMMEAELGGLKLAGLEIKGGLGTVHMNLPVPASVVPIRIDGGASMISIRRPAGVAARAHLKGWVSEFVFDGQHISQVSSDVRLQSTDYLSGAPCYDIEVSSSASMVDISAE